MANAAESRRILVKVSTDITSKLHLGVPSVASACLSRALRLITSKWAAVFLDNIGDQEHKLVKYTSDDMGDHVVS